MDDLQGIAQTNDKSSSGLPPDAADRVILEARKEGTYAGLSAGLASAVLGQKVFGFKRNMTLFCGVLSGVLSGYLFTQAFKSTALAQLHAEEARLRLAVPTSTDNPPETGTL